MSLDRSDFLSDFLVSKEIWVNWKICPFSLLKITALCSRGSSDYYFNYRIFQMSAFSRFWEKTSIKQWTTMKEYLCDYRVLLFP